VKCGWGKVISIDNNKVIFKEKSVKNVSWKNAFLGAKEIKLIFKSKAQMVSNVLQNFTAETNKKNALVELQYQTEIERGGESVLDAIIDAYIIESQEEKRKMSEFTMDFIDSRLAYLGQDLDSVERELEVFKSNNDIQAVSTTANRVLSKVQEGDVKMVELDLQVMVLDDLGKYVLGKIKNPRMAPYSAGMNQIDLNNNFAELLKLEREFELLKETNGPKSDLVVFAKKEIEVTKSIFLETIRNTRSNLLLLKRRAERDFSDANNKYSDLLHAIPSISGNRNSEIGTSEKCFTFAS
jgi:hypothetical protein